MTKFYLHNYLDNLHQQIYSSVDKIKRNSQKNIQYSADEIYKNNNYHYSYQIEGQPYQLLSKELNWLMHNQLVAYDSNGAYVAASYHQADNVLQEPKVLIDFMFKNNREFDFKV